ncbi:MAG: iron ABC transporter permease, partial [Deltaproteobacteria bacterium]|nr:iron ABC transporter permease [Deltaproteobacteria bacterium]
MERKETKIRRLSPWLTGLFLCASATAVAFISLSSGYIPYSLKEIWEIILSALYDQPNSILPNRSIVILEVRLPRLTTAFLAGAALGLSGAVFQALLLNPLADPYTLGVSSGAAFGASAVIILSLLFPQILFLSSSLAPTAGAFIFSAITLVLVIRLASDRQGRLSPASLILAGVILSAILSAAISFFKYLAGDQVGSIVFWLMGSFHDSNWTDAGIVALFLPPCLLLAMLSATDLNIMTL